MGLREEFPDFEDVVRGRGALAPCGKPAVMLAMTPRTGSTHLCAVLAAAVGVPGIEEIFNCRDVVQLLKNIHGISRFADYVETLGKARGPCFIFKTCWNDYVAVAGLQRRMFPDLRVVYLDRLDIVAQAVSMFRARTTHRWHIKRSGALIGQETIFGEVPKDRIRQAFDPAAIHRVVIDLETERLRWRDFFAAEEIDPLRISYESFADDAMNAVDYIGAQLGLTYDRPVGPDVGYVKLSDDISEQWVEQMRIYLAARR